MLRLNHRLLPVIEVGLSYCIIQLLMRFNTILRRDLRIPILAEVVGIMLLIWSSHLRFEFTYMPRYLATDTCLSGSLLI